MIKKHFLTAVILAIAILFVSAGIYASSVPDVIPLNDPAYKKHTKGIVQFEHKKHWDDYSREYPEFYPSKCGECHHDKDGKPLTELKDGDSVQKCIECHKETGKKPKGEKLKKAEKIKKYHKEALHANCKGCHKKFNKKMGYKNNDPKAAPNTCKSCHPKKKK